jgi:D-alanine--poly(phosphoribitol) ligase subunit 2
MHLTQKILDALVDITGSDVVRHDLDVPLYDRQLIDSLGTVELIVRLGEEFQLEISPADLDRGAWATPRLLIADIEQRLSLTNNTEYSPP